MERLVVLLEVLNQVYVAVFLDLMVLMACELNDSIPWHHICVADDALLVSVCIQTSYFYRRSKSSRSHPVDFSWSSISFLRLR